LGLEEELRVWEGRTFGSVLCCCCLLGSCLGSNIGCFGCLLEGEGALLLDPEDGELEEGGG